MKSYEITEQFMNNAWNIKIESEDGEFQFINTGIEENPITILGVDLDTVMFKLEKDYIVDSLSEDVENSEYKHYSVVI